VSTPCLFINFERRNFIFQIDIKAEYQQKRSSSTISVGTVEDDEILRAEPRARTDFGKKALVSKESE
jgi:hypothetical protein